MARVTVEDCLQNVKNRFELVLVATKRARQIAAGKEPSVAWENDKATVVALREIALGNVTATILDEVTAQEHAPKSGVSEDEVRKELSHLVAEPEGGESF